MTENDFDIYFFELTRLDGLEKYDLAYETACSVCERSSPEDTVELCAMLRAIAKRKDARGLLRSVLLVVKPIRNATPEITEVYEKAVDALREGSTHGIV